MKKRLVILSIAAIAAVTAGMIYRRKKAKTKVAPATTLKVAAPAPTPTNPDITMLGKTYTFPDLEKYVPIRRNDCNFIVIHLQSRLNDIAKTELAPDGVFGPLTMGAIRNLENHLSETSGIDFSGKFLTGATVTYDNLYNLTGFFNQQNA